MQSLDHIEKTHHNIVSSSSLAARKHATDLKQISWKLTIRGVSLFKCVPFSLSTWRNSCGMLEAPSFSSVGKSAVNSDLIGTSALTNEILVETSAIEEGVLGTKLWRSCCSVEKFLGSSVMSFLLLKMTRC